MDKKTRLEDIFNDDEFGILDSKPKISNVKSEDERLIESFQEINTFFEKHNREPESTNVTEFKLLSRLKALRTDAKKIEILKQFDTYNLLESYKEVSSVNDILNDDDFGILDSDDSESIFDLKNVPSQKERESTDFTARRKAMSNDSFKNYELKFKQVHSELRSGQRKLVDFNDVEQNLVEGNYYVLDGVLLYLEQDGVHERKIGDRIRKDGRTKTIFENGTISKMLYRSLAKALYNNGKIVTAKDSESEKELYQNVGVVNEGDLESGWIYILKSLSTRTDISSVENLFKIGFSTVPVVERIKNASKEPTYLMSPVQIVDSYKCYNMDAQKFEHLLHRFLSEVCLEVDVFDENNKRVTPREWFVVPLQIIEEVIPLILNGSIVNFKYNVENNSIQLKNN